MLRRLAWGGAVGPVAFVTAWAVGGATTQRPYSAVETTISRLAAIGADTRPLMTAGFVVFGLAVLAHALALRRAVPGSAWVTAVVTGVATLAVAALPLDRSSAVDGAHGIAAGVGYVSLALTPVLAARPLLRLGERWMALGGLGLAAVSTVALPVSLAVSETGLFQRLGLGAVDLWLVASVPVVRRLLR